MFYVITRVTRHSTCTITRILKIRNSKIVEDFELANAKMGREDIVVQSDESKFVKCKNNLGILLFIGVENTENTKYLILLLKNRIVKWQQN